MALCSSKKLGKREICIANYGKRRYYISELENGLDLSKTRMRIKNGSKPGENGLLKLKLKGSFFFPFDHKWSKPIPGHANR